MQTHPGVHDDLATRILKKLVATAKELEKVRVIDRASVLINAPTVRAPRPSRAEGPEPHQEAAEVKDAKAKFEKRKIGKVKHGKVKVEPEEHGAIELAKVEPEKVEKVKIIHVVHPGFRSRKKKVHPNQRWSQSAHRQRSRSRQTLGSTCRWIILEVCVKQLPRKSGIGALSLLTVMNACRKKRKKKNRSRSVKDNKKRERAKVEATSEFVSP